MVSLNEKRRQLTRDQRLAIAADIAKGLEREAKERQEEAARRAGKASGASRAGKTNVLAKMPERSSDKTYSRTKAAEAMGVAAKDVQEAKKVMELTPELESRLSLMVDGAYQW
jgi:hypothetical protein